MPLLENGKRRNHRRVWFARESAILLCYKRDEHAQKVLWMRSDVENALGTTLDFDVQNEAKYRSCFAVSDFACIAIGAVGSAKQALNEALNLRRYADARDVKIDQRWASLWFGCSIAPQNWSLPPVWASPACGLGTSAPSW